MHVAESFAGHAAVWDVGEALRSGSQDCEYISLFLRQYVRRVNE